MPAIVKDASQLSPQERASGEWSSNGPPAGSKSKGREHLDHLLGTQMYKSMPLQGKVQMLDAIMSRMSDTELKDVVKNCPDKLARAHANKVLCDRAASGDRI